MVLVISRFQLDFGKSRNTIAIAVSTKSLFVSF